MGIKSTKSQSWRLFGTILLLMLGSSLMLANSASAALFMLLDPIEGESTSKGHEKWIELNSFSFGVTNPAGVGGSSGSGAGRVAFQELTITKSTDTASPKLFEATAKGTHFPTAVLDDTINSFTFLEIKFQEVLISKFFMSASSNSVTAETLPTETLSLNYGKIEVIFNQVDNQGNINQITSGTISATAPLPGSVIFLASGLIGLICLKQKN